MEELRCEQKLAFPQHLDSAAQDVLSLSDSRFVVSWEGASQGPAAVDGQTWCGRHRMTEVELESQESLKDCNAERLTGAPAFASGVLTHRCFHHPETDEGRE